MRVDDRMRSARDPVDSLLKLHYVGGGAVAAAVEILRGALFPIHGAGAFWNASTRNSTSPSAAPANSAMMNPGTSAGRMPENESLSERPTVMAGFANDVDA